MKVFFDSSAYAKRYVQEDGSEDVLLWCARASEVAVSAIAIPVIIAAFCRRTRENKITHEQYEALKSELLKDAENLNIVGISPTASDHAITALENNVLRGMDAIHIGCALAWKTDVFISGDHRQCVAAKSAGLLVIQL